MAEWMDGSEVGSRAILTLYTLIGDTTSPGPWVSGGTRFGGDARLRVRLGGSRETDKSPSSTSSPSGPPHLS
ncbi:hypothetical protein E2C01_070485 [Portunus trituberculatus]|uniref:Uncharacterized protein n=1 Tax=Portunus trituberculatus TaxID=210409 RepID=A0A5B7HSU4_PORTR|nr:hypothetical protein [Portunus trituberculatus]